MWKQVHSMVAAHRFIEDIIKWSKGSASEFDKKRLLSYGIDEKTAKLISEMPYETDLKYGTLYANYNQWGTKTGGKQARNKIQQAIWGDVQRTIITPTATEKAIGLESLIETEEQKLKDRELGISRLDENNNVETSTKNTLESFEIDKTSEN